MIKGLKVYKNLRDSSSFASPPKSMPKFHLLVSHHGRSPKEKDQEAQTDVYYKGNKYTCNTDWLMGKGRKDDVTNRNKCLHRNDGLQWDTKYLPFYNYQVQFVMGPDSH
jgi:hypothetical protein